MWSDSIDYFRAKDHVVLWRDIQIDDTEHKVLAFGDYGSIGRNRAIYSSRGDPRW